ncbi:MAG: HAD-IA family hydrolase [Mariprofundaceae bacterium]|nr:HAD-IA family hydrolase [Mariprofundaceae bacterium]
MHSLILFDCDGTLTDSNSLIVHAIQGAFTDMGLTPPSDKHVLQSLGMSLHGVLESLLEKQAAQGVDIQALAKHYREHYWHGESDIHLYPQVLETLDILKQRGYWMAIVTGKSKQGLLRVLERFPLQDYMLTWRTADCCPSKPHPAMAQECMRELGVDKANTSLVGDAHFDMRMAQAAGIRALGVSFGMASGQVLLDEGAEAVVQSFDTLLNYFPPIQD